MGTLAEMLSTPLGVIEWFVYLLAAVMFVIGLHLMNSPKTARKGNMVSAIGMVFAVAMAFIVLFAGEASNGFKHGVAVIVLIVGIVIGAVAGVVSAKKVKMTDMPQLVSVFNTVGGGAAALVGQSAVHQQHRQTAALGQTAQRHIQSRPVSGDPDQIHRVHRALTPQQQRCRQPYQRRDADGRQRSDHAVLQKLHAATPLPYPMRQGKGRSLQVFFQILEKSAPCFAL